MATKYDMLTNDGSLALARAVATGAKLIIRGATLCKVPDGSLPYVKDVAACVWAYDPERPTSLNLDQFAITDSNNAILQLQPTSYLPCRYDSTGEETGKPVAALDIEFTLMPPNGMPPYNVIAVLADLYYMFAPFAKNGNYKTGDTVWYLGNNDVYEYYRCIESVDSSDYPQNDTTHWESVTVYNQLDPSAYGGNLQYKTISKDPILLYVSKTAGEIQVGPEIEIDYKVRLYLEIPPNSADDGEEYVRQYIVFDTLGPEFMASTQMVLLAEFADAMKHIRDVAVERAGRS